jgi:hypothetical protein
MVSSAATPGCATSAGHESDTSAPIPVLFKMQHHGHPPGGVLSVYRTGAWEFVSWDACSSVKGMLTDTEMQQLLAAVDGTELNDLSSDAASCSDTSFQIVTADRMACWAADDHVKEGGRQSIHAQLGRQQDAVVAAAGCPRARAGAERIDGSRRSRSVVARLIEQKKVGGSRRNCGAPRASRRKYLCA